MGSSPMSRWFRKLAFFVGRRRFTTDLQEEMAFHRAEAEKQLVADGVSAEEAHYRALREFGNATRLSEESVETVGFRFETFLQDLRYAARQLRLNPGFSTTAILVLALGIGATTAIFSAVNPILFEPLPYPQPRQIVMIWDGQRGGREAVAFHTYREVKERSRSFAALAAMKPFQPTLSGTAEPEKLEGQRVSADYFRVLGVTPLRGRDFQATDDVFRGPDVVIISEPLWRTRFNSDPNIVGHGIKLDAGRAVDINGGVFTVIGVMPAGFENVLAPDAVLWAPLQYDASNVNNTDTREWGHHLRMVGRLRDGAAVEEARGELAAIARTPAVEFPRPPWAALPSGFTVNALQGEVTRAIRPALFAVMGAVALVLLIACVNVTNLLLARGAQRRGEFAMRAALGAARGRLVRQLLTEAVLLAVLGGSLGLLVARFGIQALVALSPPGMPRASAIQLDRPVFLFAFIATTLIGLVVGLIPALQAARHDPHATLQQSSQRTAGGKQWTRRSLVVAEVSMALVLLVSAGLLFRSLQRLFSLDPGFDTAHLLTMQVQTSHRFPDDVTNRIFEQTLDSVRHTPGVVSAAFTSQLPLSGDLEIYGTTFEDDPRDAATPSCRYSVTGDYFQTLGIPLRRGRLLNEQDASGTALVGVISESLARRRFPQEDAIGKRFRAGGAANAPPFTVVGVVGDVRQSSLDVTSDSGAFYTPAAHWRWSDPIRSLVVRTRGDAAALTPAVRRAIWSVDKDQPIVRVATMDGLVAATEAQRRFSFVIFESFALVALLLAATGLYGVLAGSVTERTREIGVRAALGATRGNILGLILRQGMAMTAAGLVLGIGGAMLASRALITLLFGISTLDPLTYAGVAVLLLAVSLVACWAPAWRAARVDPAITLRAE